MQNIIAFGLRISIILFTLAHMMESFNNQDWLLQVLSVSGVALILFAVLSLPVSRLRLPLLILLISALMLLSAQVNPITGLFIGVGEMRNIIGLLVVIPLIKWVLEEESYVEDMIDRKSVV